MAAAPVAPELAPVLAAYDIGPVAAVAPAGGTAGRTWRVTARGGEFFLRRRGARTSGPARLEFDHRLRDHLLSRGVATAASLPTADGGRWLVRPEGVYELYPFITGRQAEADSLEHVAQAARALARYHGAAATLQPAADPETVAQYTAIGFSSRTSLRLDDPDLLRENLEAVAHLAAGSAERAVVEGCRARVDAMDAVYGGAAYERLSGWVLHGDYTPANLLWVRGADLPAREPYRSLAAAAPDADVVFVFDLDWALPGARCRDVADGLYFFGGRPRRLDGASIWSLTAAADFDARRCAHFLAAYRAATCRSDGGPPLWLSDAELACLPAAFAGRWLSIRLEGMAKVAASERFRFFCRDGDVEAPLLWLDAHWGEVLALLD